MYELFLRAKEKVGFSEIVKQLNLAPGTVKRWEEKRQVPKDYFMDLKRLCEEEIDLSKLSYREKGQFFTPTETAKRCIEVTKQVLKQNGFSFEEYTCLEPSAGNGSFSNLLPNSLAMDIEPQTQGIRKEDFLAWKPDNNKNYLTIGNPPFGLRGQQALRFLNKALSFCDFCCFILPPLFNSDGKGSPLKRVEGNLLYTEKCNSSYFYPNQEPVKVETIFQIWTSLPELGENQQEQVKPQGFQIFSLSDGGTPSTTRNKDKIGYCDYYLPSTCFGEEKMMLYKSFSDLPQQRGYGILVADKKLCSKIENMVWKKVAFYSTNGALNLRQSLIIKAIND